MGAVRGSESSLPLFLSQYQGHCLDYLHFRRGHPLPHAHAHPTALARTDLLLSFNCDVIVFLSFVQHDLFKGTGLLNMLLTEPLHPLQWHRRLPLPLPSSPPHSFLTLTFRYASIPHHTSSWALPFLSACFIPYCSLLRILAPFFRQLAPKCHPKFNILCSFFPCLHKRPISSFPLLCLIIFL